VLYFYITKNVELIDILTLLENILLIITIFPLLVGFKDLLCQN
jgi:hypothetical protein